MRAAPTTASAGRSPAIRSARARVQHRGDSARADQPDMPRVAHRIGRERRRLVRGSAIDLAGRTAQILGATGPNHRVHRLAMQHAVGGDGDPAVGADDDEARAVERLVVRQPARVGIARGTAMDDQRVEPVALHVGAHRREAAVIFGVARIPARDISGARRGRTERASWRASRGPRARLRVRRCVRRRKHSARFPPDM